MVASLGVPIFRVFTVVSIAINIYTMFSFSDDVTKWSHATMQVT